MSAEMFKEKAEGWRGDGGRQRGGDDEEEQRGQR